MAFERNDLAIERAFWSTDLIDWEDVRSVHDWQKYDWNPYWIRRIEFRPNQYGDTPIRDIFAQIVDGEVQLWRG